MDMKNRPTPRKIGGHSELKVVDEGWKFQKPKNGMVITDINEEGIADADKEDIADADEEDISDAESAHKEDLIQIKHFPVVLKGQSWHQKLSQLVQKKCHSFYLSSDSFSALSWPFV